MPTWAVTQMPPDRGGRAGEGVRAGTRGSLRVCSGENALARAITGARSPYESPRDTHTQSDVTVRILDIIVIILRSLLPYGYLPVWYWVRQRQAMR